MELEEKNINLYYGEYDYNGSYLPSHFHNRYEIFLMISGSRTFFINDKAFIIKKNDVVLFKKNIIHSNLPIDGVKGERFTIEFSDAAIMLNNYNSSFSLLDVFYQDNFIFNVTDYTMLFLTKLLKKLYMELKNKEPGYDLYVSTILTELLLVISRLNKNDDMTSEKVSMHKATYKVIEYIKLNFSETITLNLLEKKLGITSFHICKIFKKDTGCTVIEYLNGTRITEAMKMLIESNISITMVSCNCGFNNVNHFNLMFKRYTGITPGKYRKMGYVEK